MCHIPYRCRSLIWLVVCVLFACCECEEVLSDVGVQGNRNPHSGHTGNGNAMKMMKMQKRGDVDVQTCVDNFGIHKDKIIRTTDSRAMGAKYLNEIDLDTRDECLRLCCETDNCDVFVYEEKNAGSCYLFQCGPPEDFKCKFTHHVNYTSAILGINRHLPDLESEIKLTKHELELSKLRKPEITNTGNVEIVPQQATTQPPKKVTTSKPITTIVAKLQNDHVDINSPSAPSPRTEAPLSPPKTVQHQPTIGTSLPDRKCKEYQFECRSTGECIAIYNACDGIPQCADGSDEGPELKCPADATTLGPQLAPQQQMPPPQQVPQRQPQQFAPKLQQPDFLRPVADPLNPLHGPQYDPQQLAQYPYLAPGQTNWGHQQPPMVQHYGQFPSNKNSHIFNHKEIGLQVPDVGESSQMQYSADGRDYQKFPNYYGTDVYGQQMPQLQQLPENNWPNNNNQPDFRGNVYPNQEMNAGGRETWSQNVPQSVKSEANKLIYNKPATKELLPLMNEKELPKHEQEKVAAELKNSKQHFANQNQNQNTDETLASSSLKTQKGEHSANDGHDHDQHPHGKYVVAEYKIAADTLEVIEDGIAETPGGAVLSLTLGLILTALMGILIGCRLRVVRRRLRRGGKSYAHDADYLVNGMYL